MSRHNDQTRLRLMLEHAREAAEMARGRRREDLDADRQLNLALVRLVEVIGEAAAHVSQASRDRLPDIPWSSVVSLRNRLIHGYEEVDFDVLWDIVEADLPPLIEALQRALGSDGGGGG